MPLSRCPGPGAERLLIHQRLQSFDIRSRFEQIRFRLRKICLRLQEAHLSGREILIG